MLRRRTATLLATAAVAGAALATATAALALQPITYFGSFGRDAGELWNPGGLAIDGDGHFYVADTGNDRIDVFSPTGDFIRAFGKGVNPAGGNVCTSVCQAGEGVGAAGGMVSPQDVAVGLSGDLFIADTGNNRIDVFSPTGDFIRAFGKGVNPAGGDVCTSVCQTGEESASAGSVRQPLGIGISAAGAVLVAESWNNRIGVFSPTGDFIRAFGKGVNPAGGDVCTSECQTGEESAEAGAFVVPWDAAVGPDGEIVVTGSGNNRIDVFSPTGDFIRAFGKGVNPAGGNVCTSVCQAGEGVGDAGALHGPTPIVASGTGSFYVGDLWNARVGEFSPDGTFIRAFGRGVIDEAPALQVCTLVTGCLPGVADTTIVSVPFPRGLAVDCRGTIYVVVGNYGADFARVVRYGEFATHPPPCDGSEPELEPEPEPEGEGGPKPKPKPTPKTSPTTPGSSPGGTPTTTAKAGSASRFKLLKVKLFRRLGIARLTVDVPGAGTLQLSGNGIRTATKTAARAGLVTLVVRSRGKSKSALEATGKVTILVKVTFTPSAQASSSQTKALRLKKLLR